MAEPYKHKVGTKERVAAWNQIAERLNAIPDVGFKVSQGAVRERFDNLMMKFKSKEANEKRASGITTEYDEIDQSLSDIKERMEDAEQSMHCIKEKEIQTQQQMLLQQGQFQQQLLQNNQQLQQQQQAVNMAMLNAIGELVKSLKK